MDSTKLALFGGKKLIDYDLENYKSIGVEELNAAKDVIESGVLSRFLGCWDDDFYGGPKIRQFEKACEEYFKVKYAVSVNSWTSGLICAVGAIGIQPGDEVIVTPWTMCATATAILHWNAIPVFVDIEEETFNIDPKEIEKNITENTKAIIGVDIFGHSCDVDSLRYLAEKYNLKIITDSAQSPGVLNKGRITGTIGDVGGYSLNYHKHIHTGEGGIIVTNDLEIYERLQLIRNHAEAVVEEKGHEDLANMIGHNFRLGEIEAAIGIEQLKKLDRIVFSRQEYAEKISEGICNLEGLRTPLIKDGCTHAYYVYPIVLDIDSLNVSREMIVKALLAEGVYVCAGYQNIHLLPLYQKKIAYGSNGFPWTSSICKREINYNKGICPIAENLHEKTFIYLPMCMFEFSDVDIENIIKAFHKVWRNLDELRTN